MTTPMLIALIGGIVWIGIIALVLRFLAGATAEPEITDDLRKPYEKPVLRRIK